MKPDGFIVATGAVGIAIGIAQLLSHLGVADSVDWPWTIGGALLGICLAYAGLGDRLVFGIGLFVFLCSIISLFKQIGAFPEEYVGSIQMIVAGILIVAFQFIKFPDESTSV